MQYNNEDTKGEKEVVIVITVLSEPHPSEGTVYKRVGSFKKEGSIL